LYKQKIKTMISILVKKYPNDADLGENVRKYYNSFNEMFSFLSQQDEPFSGQFNSGYFRIGSWERTSNVKVLDKLTELGFYERVDVDEDTGEMINYQYKF